MESLEQIKVRAEAAIPGAKIDIVLNPGPANQPSLLIDNEYALGIAKFLRDDPALRQTGVSEGKRVRSARSLLRMRIITGPCLCIIE